MGRDACLTSDSPAEVLSRSDECRREAPSDHHHSEATLGGSSLAMKGGTDVRAEVDLGIKFREKARRILSLVRCRAKQWGARSVLPSRGLGELHGLLPRAFVMPVDA